MRSIVGEVRAAREVSAPIWERGGLANARRKWLHYRSLDGQSVGAGQVAGDLEPILRALEEAADEIDRLYALGIGQ